MVVIREDVSTLIGKFGKNATDELEWFSGIIGFSVELNQGVERIELNPDRPDLYSFSTLFEAINIFKKRKESTPIEFNDPLISLHVSDDVLKLRKFILCFSASGDALSANFHEIIDYQEKLHQTIGKDRVKFAIGIHDLKDLKPPFRYVSMGVNDIKFTTYDGKLSGSPSEILSRHELGLEYSHLISDKNHVPLILDSTGNVLSMPPIVNGYVSRISETAKDIFVDITGDDWISVRSAFYLIANYLKSIGFTLHKVKQNLGYRNDLLRYNNRKIIVPMEQINDVLGVDLPISTIENSLTEMGYFVSRNRRGVSVSVKGSRSDVMGQVDVIEDVGKAYGYDRIPNAMPDLGTIGQVSRISTREDYIRSVLIGMGLQEIYTFFLEPSSYYVGADYHGNVEIVNPKSLDFSIPRDRLMFGLLDFFRLNKRRKLPQEIFEIGKVVIDLNEKLHLCVGITNSRASFSDIKKIVEPFLSRLNLSMTVKSVSDLYGFVEGRTGSVIVDGKDVGIIGEIHPALLEKFELVNPVAIVEFDLDSLKQ